MLFVLLNSIDKLGPSCHVSGRGGESVKLISRTTGAKVICPKDSGRSLETTGNVTITGTRQEVRQAKVRDSTPTARGGILPIFCKRFIFYLAMACRILCFKILMAAPSTLLVLKFVVSCHLTPRND